MLPDRDLPAPEPRRGDPARVRDASRRVLEEAARELIAPAWALGVRASAVRRPRRMSARERELLDLVSVHAQRIARVLTGVFDYLYLEAEEHIPVDPRPCSMKGVCEAALDELRETGIAVEASYAGAGEGEGEWDPGRLSQAISYLLEVAATYGRSSEPIALRWRGDGDEVVVRVEVGRAGIPALIEPDWGEHVHDGVEGGVRAFLARRIVLAHGGALARHIAKDAVSFVVVLPRRTPEDPQF
jgi:sigma-B regulation protein RsbU (phosphoserine phosphatase)